MSSKSKVWFMSNKNINFLKSVTNLLHENVQKGFLNLRSLPGCAITQYQASQLIGEYKKVKKTDNLKGTECSYMIIIELADKLKLMITFKQMQKVPQNNQHFTFDLIVQQNQLKIKIIISKSRIAKIQAEPQRIYSLIKMLNDKIFREFKSQPFEQSYNGSHEFEEFRETLMIDQIMKCGKQILGSIGISIDEQQTQEQQNQRSSVRNSALRKIKQKPQYIYEYDYGKDHRNSRKSLNDQLDYPADQISFTLSNQDYRPEETPHERYQENFKNQRHIQWRNNLLNSDILPIKKQNFKANTNQMPVQYIRPTKTFQRSPPQSQKTRKNQLLTDKNLANNNFPLKKHALPNQTHQKTNNQTSAKQIQFRTPQKMTKTSKKTLKVPLSQQITKNIYGKLKTQVEDQTFLEEYEQRSKKSQEENQQKWKGFILRSEKWTDEKNNHLIQMQMTEKYSSPQKSRSKFKNNTENGYSSYVSLKVKQQTTQPGSKYDTVRNDIKLPQNTFKTNKNSPEKRQSSVQNCINKLKTQTQLLKVKLLSPLKQRINDNTEIEHYKQLNESESRISIKKYRQNYEEKPFAKTSSTLIHVQNLYGKCIGGEKTSK